MITLQHIEQAHSLIKEYVSQTPLLTSRTLREMTGAAQVYLKCENMQVTGSFKVRGAFHRLRHLPAGSRVIAASMGNHAQGVAYAARQLGLQATVVIPHAAPLTKQAAVRAYGATLVLHGSSLTEALQHARSFDTHEFIHPYDDEDVMSGQGTVGLEIMRQIDEPPDLVIVPVGGGGLIAGIATAIKGLHPQGQVMGIQSTAAVSAMRSFHEGEISEHQPGVTIADGIAVGRVGQQCLPVMLRHVDNIRAVEDGGIARAVLLLIERKRIVVEGAGAVGIAWLLDNAETVRGKRVVVVLSGGNIDLTLIDRIVHRGMLESGRVGVIDVVVADRPGALNRVTGVIAQHGGNVISVRHERLTPDLPLNSTRMSLTIEVSDSEHLKRILDGLAHEGFSLNARGQSGVPED